MILTTELLEGLPQFPELELLEFMENEHWEGLDHKQIFKEIADKKDASWIPTYLYPALKLSGTLRRYRDEELVLEVPIVNGRMHGIKSYKNIDGESSKELYYEGKTMMPLEKNITGKRK